MNCKKDLLEYFEKTKLNYHFDDNVQNGIRQLNPMVCTPNIKELKYGDMVNKDNINKIALGLPANINLKEFIGTVYDQKDMDIAVSCCISSCITIRTNYINYQRYRLVKFFFGNRVPPINPSIFYINWNATIQNNQKNKELNVSTSGISPSIYSHLISLESHKIVDVNKYADTPEKLNREPNLISFYHASKSKDFTWNKVPQDEFALKLLLKDGYPIICAIVIYENALDLISYQFGTIKTPNLDIDICPVGSTPITIIGYDESKKIFHTLHSWSQNWGDDGMGQIGYDYILNNKLAGDFAILDYKI